MKLYTFDGSPTSRMILLFCAEEGLEFEKVDIDLLAGAHLTEGYQNINPCALVPVLEDDEYRLTESSASLKYLADKHESKAYPRDPKLRGRVHEAMDWFNTSLYRVMGYDFIYPQIYGHHRRPSEDLNRGTIEWGRQRTRQCLHLLDTHWLGAKRFLCGNEITIADFFGAPIVSQLDLIGVTVEPLTNVARWMAEMSRLKTWNDVHTMHTRYAASLADREFVVL